MQGPCERRGTEGEAGGAGGNRDAPRVRKSQEKKRALAKAAGQRGTKGAVGEFIKQQLWSVDNAERKTGDSDSVKRLEKHPGLHPC